MKRKLPQLLIFASALIVLASSCSNDDGSDMPPTTPPSTVSTMLGEAPVLTQAEFDSLVKGHGWYSYDYWEIDSETHTIVDRGDLAEKMEEAGYPLPGDGPFTIYDVMLGGSPRKILFSDATVTEFQLSTVPPQAPYAEKKSYAYDPSCNAISIGNGQKHDRLVVLSAGPDTLKTITYHEIDRGQYCYEIFLRASEEDVQEWMNACQAQQE